MLGVVVGVCGDYACGLEDERGVDVDWELYVALLVAV